MSNRTAPSVGFFVPSGVGLGYTGPGVFLKRLIEPLGESIIPRLYAGERPGHETDPRHVPARAMKVGGGGLVRQLAWSIIATWWILLDHRKLDAVHFHGTYLYKILPALACMLFRVPYVLVPLASNADFSLSGKSSQLPGVRPLIRFIARRASGGFALGEEIAEELRSGGVRSARVHMIMNPVSGEFFAEPDAERFEQQTLLFVGVLGRRKRPDLVLEAVHQLRGDGVDCRAIFLGPMADPAYRDLFYATAERLGVASFVEHVEFSEEVSSYMLERGSVFVLLSETEGIPGALVEAMAAGLPSVVTDVGAMGDIVESSAGGKVVSSDPVDVVGSVREFLSDEAKWNDTSKRARSYAELHFKAEAIASTYLAQLLEAVGDRPRFTRQADAAAR